MGGMDGHTPHVADEHAQQAQRTHRMGLGLFHTQHLDKDAIQRVTPPAKKIELLIN